MRVSNTLYGPVEISADRGATWTLVARVVKPAVDRAPGASSTLPVVDRASAQGMAFVISKGHLVRLLPDTPANFRDPAAIVINRRPTDSFFRDLLPPAGTPVQQVVNKKAAPLPDDYMPHDGDEYLFSVSRTDLTAAQVPALVKDAAERYRDYAAAKLRASGKKPYSGALTVNASVAPGDKVNAVTYLLDGNVLAIQNQPPFTLKVNTKDWSNGEHVLEIRGLDAAGATATEKKLLIVVDNSAAG